MSASPGHTYSHDVLGNRTWRDNGLTTAQKYRWDELNRMTATYNHTTGAQYMYRPDGMRVVKLSNITLDWTAVTDDGYASGYYDTITTTNVPTTRYYYDGQMLMEDDWTRPVSSVTTKDVTKYGLGARGIDVIIATTGITSSNEGTTSTTFPLYDAHGNMVNTLSRASGGSFALGNSSFRYYDAWGSLDTGPGAGNEPRQRYCANLGHLQDDESGLIYMRARYYEPGTGRFVSEDPARDEDNWFGYCGGEPINKADFSGTRWKGVTCYILSFGLGMAVNVMFAFFGGDVLVGCALNTLVGMLASELLEEELLAFGTSVDTFFRRGAQALSQATKRTIKAITSRYRKVISSIKSLDKKDGGNGPGSAAIIAVCFYTGIIVSQLIMNDCEEALSQ